MIWISLVVNLALLVLVALLLICQTPDPPAGFRGRTLTLNFEDPPYLLYFRLDPESSPDPEGMRAADEAVQRYFAEEDLLGKEPVRIVFGRPA